jgi:hypothetical protein
VPLEGVVNALHRIHAALVPGGLVIDTQPISDWPLVRTDDGDLGRIDMEGWIELVWAVDERIAEVVDAGLFRLEKKPGFMVVDSFPNGPALAETVKDWQRASIPAELGERLARHDGPAEVHQRVRLRVLRAL